MAHCVAYDFSYGETLAENGLISVPVALAYRRSFPLLQVLYMRVVWAIFMLSCDSSENKRCGLADSTDGPFYVIFIAEAPLWTYLLVANIHFWAMVWQSIALNQVFATNRGCGLPFFFFLVLWLQDSRFVDEIEEKMPDYNIYGIEHMRNMFQVRFALARVLHFGDFTQMFVIRPFL